ncbi:MAG: large subunit ribosomal protein L18 [Cognaticolwellia sp.]|jgi:large subunit ribosomal protein L18
MKVTKKQRRKRIHYRIRKKVLGTAERPRLCVFRSNNHIYVQAIDDTDGRTLFGASSAEGSISAEGTPIEQSKKVGLLLAEKAKGASIGTVKFDRNGYLYHGRVKALAEGAREGGLIF